MSGRKILLWGGLGVAGASGYYLYQAGGDTQLAQKKAEIDAEKLRAQYKGEEAKISEAQKKGEDWAKSAGKQIDRTADDIRNKTNKADASVSAELNKTGTKIDQFADNTRSSLDKTRKDTGKNINEAIETFDKTVTQKTSEAKSGIASWFGSGK